MTEKLLLFACALLLILATSAQAQWIQTNGPNAGDIHALVVGGTSSSSPTVFAGTGGGVYLSSDNGANWAAENAGLTNIAVYALAMKISTDGRDTNLFAGTYGSGVFRSTDMGATWTAAGLSSSIVDAFAVSGANLFAGTYSGLFRSTDNGANWTAASTGMANPTVWSFAVNVSADGLDTNIFVGTYLDGVFRSSDNGANWTPTSSGLTDSSVFSLALTGANSASPVLFAGTYQSGVFRSTDNGASWTAASAGLTDFSVYSIEVSGANSSSPILFAGTHDSLYRSIDEGARWTAVSIGLAEPSIYALAMSDENSPSPMLFAGAGYGHVWRRLLSEMTGSDAVAQNAQPAESPAQAYPNPFPEKTSVHFTMAERGQAQISIVNLLGQQVARLFDGELDAGEHSFDWNATGATAGTYFCIVRANGRVERAAMVLAR